MFEYELILFLFYRSLYRSHLKAACEYEIDNLAFIFPIKKITRFFCVLQFNEYIYWNEPETEKEINKKC